MNQEFIAVIPPAAVREPRGAEVAAQLAAGLQRVAQRLAAAGRGVWRALEDEGRRRAMQQLKSRGLSLPAFEAAQVRKLADQHERTDPRFAAELRAAATRHETMHGIS
ncbi:MAG: hypothetical protein JNN03_16730 [Rubrivivax sp.]|nr:hypothetical protein [Rubrivivax sp.]